VIVGGANSDLLSITPEAWSVTVLLLAHSDFGALLLQFCSR